MIRSVHALARSKSISSCPDCSTVRITVFEHADIQILAVCLSRIWSEVGKQGLNDGTYVYYIQPRLRTAELACDLCTRSICKE